jgi:hypothetical protein
VNEDQASRTNLDGHPCPPWCQTDHEEVHGPAGHFRAHRGIRTTIEVPGRSAHLKDQIVAGPVHDGTERGAPHVGVLAIRYGRDDQDPQLLLKPGDAEDLAAILDMLDDWSQVGELVAAIRKAATDITNETGEKP